jgi:hypothetical protein
MPEIHTEFYIAKPSDSMNWVLIQSPNGTTVDVELAIMDFRYDCKPQLIEVEENGVTSKIWCSRICCYAGAYVSPEEILNTKKILPTLKKDLQEDSIKFLKENNDIFHVPEDHDQEENLYKTCCIPNEWNYATDDEEDEETEEFEVNDDDEEYEENEDFNEIEEGEEEYDDEFDLPPKNHCVFLMENGYCATHKYYLEHKQNWVKEKFNICVTFPLDIRPSDNTIAFMAHYDEFAFTEVHCLTKDENQKKERGYPQIIESMKYAIVDRYNEDFWNALNKFSQDYRAGKITAAMIYEDYEVIQIE